MLDVRSIWKPCIVFEIGFRVVTALGERLGDESIPVWKSVQHHIHAQGAHTHLCHSAPAYTITSLQPSHQRTIFLGCQFAVRMDSQTERIRANPTRIR